jgi:hypothetical protein
MTRSLVRQLLVTEVKTLVFVIRSWIYYGNRQAAAKCIMANIGGVAGDSTGELPDYFYPPNGSGISEPPAIIVEGVGAKLISDSSVTTILSYR